MPTHMDTTDPLPPPRHGLPVPTPAAAALVVDPAAVPEHDRRLIERLRREVRHMDFEPLADEAVARQVARWPSAAASTAIEGNPLSPSDHLLTRMLFEERVPAGADAALSARFARECQAAVERRRNHP